MVTKITGGKIISNGELLLGQSVYIENEKITAVTDENLPYDSVTDANGNYISAGFIDLHVHGGGGYDFTDGGVAAIVSAAEFHAEHGTTSIYPTSPACTEDKLNNFLHDVSEAKTKRVNILGAHLEGPYFSDRQCGALSPGLIRPPEKSEYERLISRWGHIIKRWSFAPELRGSDEFYDYLRGHGIVGSMGHSDAVLEDVMRVFEKGCKLVTHLYSCTSTITRDRGYRRLGITEAAYLLDDLTVEVIADGKHLPTELLQIIYKGKGADKICLVTDAMRGAGMPEGPSFIGSHDEGIPCVIEDGVAKLLDYSCFAGSVATADRLVRTYIGAGIPLPKAVKMITKTPATAMNLTEKGDIRVGMDADIVIFDENINIKKVIVMGNTI